MDENISPMKKAQRKYEQAHKQERKESSGQFNTRLPRREFDEICDFLEKNNIRKIDLIYAGYEFLREEVRLNANKDYHDQMILRLQPGQSVWMMDLGMFDVHEYTFLARCPRDIGSTDQALILAVRPVDARTYEQLVDFLLKDCRGGFETDLIVACPDQIYFSREEAEAQMERDEE